MINITDQPFDPSQVLHEFIERSEGCGAIVSFTGLVRHEADTQDVTKLHLQAYSPLTENGIIQAANIAEQKWDLKAFRVIHRIGDLLPSEPIVFVATASPHRRDAFRAADYLMDYLKTEAVFWKKETTTGGENWIEPRPVDYQDAKRWKVS